MAFRLFTTTLAADGDADDNGVPDACEAPEPPVAAAGIRTRFISVSVPPPPVASAGGTTALRVGLLSLHHVVPPYTGGPSIPFTSFEGEVRWAGPPAEYEESGTNPTIITVSALQCDPYYHDWSTISVLHITGNAITPSSTYEVASVSSNCMGTEDTCSAISTSVQLSTTRWGDVRSPYNPPDPSVQPDISDVSALVDKFRSAVGALSKVEGLLSGEPGNPNGEITAAVLDVDFGFSHISACVDAYRGAPYPYVPSGCP